MIFFDDVNGSREVVSESLNHESVYNSVNEVNEKYVQEKSG